ncbi:MAG: LysR family transcriptional regulator [Eubacteriales bacterium]|nr:LysR family transcriptional regulator [Eubacteriales bacterium]
MNLERYRIFYEVACRGSFSAAAQALFVTQSAVSQSMSLLEDELGAALFARLPRGVALTAEGRALLSHVKQAMEALEAGQRQVEKLRSLEEGLLSLAASDTVAEKLLLPCLDRFHATYPHIRLRVMNKTSPDILTLLHSGEVELGFVNLPLLDRDVTFLPCLEVHDVFVASPEVAAEFHGAVTPEGLQRCRLIMLENLSNSRHYVDAWFARQGLSLAPETELGAHALLLDFARVGLGVSCVIREFAQKELQEGSLVELALEPPIPHRHLALCHSARASLSPAASAFVSMLSPLLETAAEVSR